MEAKDILEVIANDKYYVTFDWYTPRPHMIIVGKKDTEFESKCLKSMIPTSGIPMFTEMSDNDKKDLIDIATATYSKVMKFQSVADIPGVGSPAVLSLHFGSWFAQKSDHFHAHVCINIESYVDFITIYKHDNVLKNKMFKGLTVYLKNARRQPKDFTNANIEAFEKVSLEKDGGQYDLLKKDAGLQSLAYNENYMRIGFLSDKYDNLTLMKVMDNLVSSHDFLKENGGHIVIDLGKGGFPGYRMLIDSSEVQQAKVRGYLQLRGDSFGTLLRAFGIGQEWLKKYNHTEMSIVYT